MQLEGRSLRSDFGKFTTATIASLMIFSLYSMADGLFVARGVGEDAMSAVNLVVPFLNGIFSIAVLFAVGTSTIIAICLGQGKKEEANRLFSQNFTVLLVIGFAITGLVFAFLEPFSRLLGATPETMTYVQHYLAGLAPFAVCFILSYNLEILVKTDGHPRLAMACVITGCLANCVMDYVAIFLLGWGIWGAAVATGLSQLLTCLIYLSHFLGKKCTFHPVRFSMDWHIYRRLVPIGLADGVTELCNGLMIFLFNRTILRCVGQSGLIAYTIIAYANTLIINVMVGVSQGMQPLVSYQYGKGTYSACRRLLRYGLITVSAVAVVFFAGLYLFAPQLVQAFLGMKDPALNSYAAHAFRQYSFCYLPVGFNILIGGFLTALEQPRPAVTISVGRGFVIQSVCLFCLSLLWGGDAIWYTTLLSEILCLALSGFLLRRPYGLLGKSSSPRI